MKRKKKAFWKKEIKNKELPALDKLFQQQFGDWFKSGFYPQKGAKINWGERNGRFYLGSKCR